MPFKKERIRGFGGYLDRRSQPDAMGHENFRLVLNAAMRGRGKRCRRGGHKRFLDGVNESYNNEDLHDQLLGLSFYYEEFSERIVTPGGFTGSIYQYWFPGVNDPSSVDKEVLGIEFEYYPDFLGIYDFPPHDGLAIDDPIVIGYPYNVIEAIYPYEPSDVEVLGVYYVPSSFILVDATYVPGEVIEAYGFGDQIPIYTDASAYTNTYCGTYPYLHDTCNEKITYISSVGNSEGERTLIAATKSRIYAMNVSMGNWRIVADGLGGPIRLDEDCEGCSPVRFLGGVVNNVIVLSNDIDPVMAYNPIAQPTGCDVWRAEPIQDLLTLKILTAGCVGAWKSFAFLGDVYQDGSRRRNRIVWSDFNDPYTWIPGDDNLSGFQDLGLDETIMRIEGMNDYLFIYTDQSIYRGALVQSAGFVTFVFEEIYRGHAGACKYRYAFANAGESHYYWGENRLNKMTSYEKKPLEPIVLRLVSNAVFEGVSEDDLTFGPLNKAACDHFIGGFNEEFKEVWFSWPSGAGSQCPNMSMVINISHGEEGVDFVDEGYSAFHWWDGRDSVALFEWLERIEVCERADLLSDLVKEGLPYSLTGDPFTSPVMSIWNSTEDTDLPPDPDSLCAAVTDDWVRDVCSDCNAIARFVMASVQDNALKEYQDKSFYREFIEGGVYVMGGYSTVLQSGLHDFGTHDHKEINDFTVVFDAADQTSPNLLYLELSATNTPGCARWAPQRFYDDDCEELSEGIPLDCLTEMSDEEHDDEWTRPDDNASWPVKERGRYIGWRLKIVGTGGGACFSSGSMNIKKLET